MNKWSTPQNEVALRILKAADELMAKEGMDHLSTHKIAKAAKVSVGTIYLYFKDKDDLLSQLVHYLFESHEQYFARHYDPSLPLFEQYKILWRCALEFMQQNPNIISNWHQYHSLPSHKDLMKNCITQESLVWNRFIKAGQDQGVIVNLDTHILFTLTMKVPWEIMQLQAILDKTYSTAEIDEIILRTWKAITL